MKNIDILIRSVGIENWKLAASILNVDSATLVKTIMHYIWEDGVYLGIWNAIRQSDDNWSILCNFKYGPFNIMYGAMASDRFNGFFKFAYNNGMPYDRTNIPYRDMKEHIEHAINNNILADII